MLLDFSTIEMLLIKSNLRTGTKYMLNVGEYLE